MVITGVPPKIQTLSHSDVTLYQVNFNAIQKLFYTAPDPSPSGTNGITQHLYLGHAEKHGLNNSDILVS